MFKNGITLLVIAAAAASLVSAGAALDKAHTIPKNPVVKKVTRSHGKISLTLADGTVLHTKEHVRATKVKKVLGKESQGDVDGEIIRKYKNGIVKIASKKQPVASVEQKVVKKVAPSYKQVEAEAEDEEDETSEGQGEDDETPEGQDEEDETPEGQEQDETTEGQGSESSAYGAVVDEVDDQAEGSESTSGSVAGGAVAGAPGSTTAASADVDLESGESVSLTFGNHNVTLTLLQNGTLELEADDTVQYLPPADDVTVEFDGSADFEASEDETDVKHKKMALDKKIVNQKVVQNEVKENKKVVKKEVGLVEGIENKVTEFVTQLQGDSSEYFTKKSTPFLIGCGLVGALAIVVGIAAVAIGRARDHAAAAADPQSVLAESEEDEDLEAANSADASADDSESLSDAEAEEGTFANEAVVVSV